ncbi:maltotransferase domain-containing protein, partial [Streptomyces sp. NPDC020898]|uniref:maltotransferase domain-containing protein n=1 Tax=Streptomyces sp. NPDC020898 TaxID=3365101 RepID=UPI0037BCCA30
MPATHHSSAPPTPTTGEPPIPTKDTTVPPTPETPSPAPSTSPVTSSTTRPTTPEASSSPRPTPPEKPVPAIPPARDTPAGTAPTPRDTPAATAPPATEPAREPAAVPKAEPLPVDAGTAVGRIPVLDVRPLVTNGRRPAKAVVGEAFEVSATVFREGHDAVAANVVLRDPKGRPGRWTPMRELAPGTDRWGATVEADAPGEWTYTVEAWGDPITTWRHHAGIKIPAGMDTELVLEEGATLYERAAADVPMSKNKNKAKRDVLLTAAEALRDAERPAAARLAAALTPAVDKVLARYPLRELVTSSEPLALLV